MKAKRRLGRQLLEFRQQSMMPGGDPPARITPVRGGRRPFWSVMISTYNGDESLTEALRSVLAQDPGPTHMQIEVVDDHSTRTDPESVVRRVAGERVSFFRQALNVGHTANFNTCLERSRGTVVHLLHDDDLVRRGFYRTLEPVFRAHADVGSAVTRHIFADPRGHWRSLSTLEQPHAGILEDWLPKIASGMRLTTPAVTIRRSVFEEIGGFDARLRAGADWEMYVRIASRFRVWFEPEPLAVHRYAPSGLPTGDDGGTTILLDDLLQASAIIESYLRDYLPGDQAALILHQARETYGRWSFSTVPALLAGGDRRAAAESIKVGLVAAPSPAMVAALLGMLSRGGLRRLARTGRAA